MFSIYKSRGYFVSRIGEGQSAGVIFDNAEGLVKKYVVRVSKVGNTLTCECIADPRQLITDPHNPCIGFAKILISQQEAPSTVEICGVVSTSFVLQIVLVSLGFVGLLLHGTNGFDNIVFAALLLVITVISVGELVAVYCRTRLRNLANYIIKHVSVR